MAYLAASQPGPGQGRRHLRWPSRLSAEDVAGYRECV